ncbi:MAG: c-type cytochrome [Acidobacteria bacterium]|nr:c-type cytochrome [Acidobacteriota bacterium]MDA1236277.1 c-type cytochrome [Acidobacteriota bacterium]
MDRRLIAALLCLALISVVGAEPKRPLGLDLYRPSPRDNPVTLEKVKLGRLLFRDRLLSRDGSLSCSDCHRRKQAFTDGRAKAVGVYGREGPRSVPTLVNRAWGQSFFWDGRIRTLEEQVVQPILAKLEMDLTLEEAVERLRGKHRYRKDFQSVFDRAVNAEDLAKALATYVRTIQSGDSPYDRYVLGENDALSESALEGLKLFRGKANCTVCHAGPTLSDEEFHNTGVAWRDGKFLDDGRYAVTKDERDRGKFKTPTLREIARTGPYMHDGSISTLKEVIDFYSDGGRENPNRDPEVRLLKLNGDEKAALSAFLRSLSGELSDGG